MVVEVIRSMANRLTLMNWLHSFQKVFSVEKRLLAAWKYYR